MAELHAGQLQLAADLDPKQLVAHDLNGPASRSAHGPAAGGLQLESAVVPLRPFNNPFARLGRYRPQFAAGDHHKVAPVPSATTVPLHKFVGGAMGVIPLNPWRRSPPVIEIAKTATPPRGLLRACQTPLAR